MKKGFLSKSISRRDKYTLCSLLVIFFLLLVIYFWSDLILLGLNIKRVIIKKDNELTLTEAMYYSRLPNNKVQCLLCPRKCILKDGQRGFCNARKNKGGKLYSLVYGKAIWYSIPMYQRSLVYCTTDYNFLGIGTAGCNMKCKFCLTWELSQALPQEIEILPSYNNADAISGASPCRTISLAPEDIINLAKKNNCKLIAYTFNEPTIYYEYMLDVAKLAKEEGLINVFVTCGYINKEPLRELLKYMDGVSLGLKGFTDEIYRKYCSAELKPVLETLKILKNEKIGFEITYVVIPTVNDDLEQIRNMCIWIKDNLGERVPLHLYRYTPAYRLKRLPPTPISTLLTVKQLANEVGLKYVYIYYLGPYPDPEFEDKIYCPNCGKLILYRKGINLLVNNTVKGKCKFCDEKVSYIVFD